MDPKLLLSVAGAATGALIIGLVVFTISPAVSQNNLEEVAHYQPVSDNGTNVAPKLESLPADYTSPINNNNTLARNDDDKNGAGPVAREITEATPFSNSGAPKIELDTKPAHQDQPLLTSPPRNSTFVAAGDLGCKSSAADTVNTIESLNPDLVFALGDLSYRSESDCWDQLIKPIFDKTRIVIGNHDVIFPKMLDNYTRNFNLPNQYYSFDHNNVHVLVLSSETDYSIGSPQYNFVKADLAKAASNATIDWIIALVHRPMYTSSTNQPAPPDLRSTYHPLFDQYGVDLVLMGHNHNYQRTYPLMFNSRDPSIPIVTSNSKTCYNNPDGQVYLIVGTGGQSSSYLKTQKEFVIRQFSDKHGVAKIDITNIQNENGTSTIMSVGFYKNGNLQNPIDPFQITKQVSASDAC